MFRDATVKVCEAPSRQMDGTATWVLLQLKLVNMPTQAVGVAKEAS